MVNEVQGNTRCRNCPVLEVKPFTYHLLRIPIFTSNTSQLLLWWLLLLLSLAPVCWKAAPGAYISGEASLRLAATLSLSFAVFQTASSCLLPPPPVVFLRLLPLLSPASFPSPSASSSTTLDLFFLAFPTSSSSPYSWLLYVLPLLFLPPYSSAVM